MNEDLIADIWTTISEHVPEKNRKDTAYEYVNVLLDYGIQQSVLEGLMGVDPFLDGAVEYALDDETAGEPEEEEEWD
jgi:hypothetical protein